MSQEQCSRDLAAGEDLAYLVFAETNTNLDAGDGVCTFELIPSDDGNDPLVDGDDRHGFLLADCFVNLGRYTVRAMLRPSTILNSGSSGLSSPRWLRRHRPQCGPSSACLAHS